MSKVKAFVNVHLVLKESGKTLFSLRKNTGYGDGYFSLVSGHVEQNESAISAMVREAKEEVDITLSPDDLQLIHTMHRFTDRENVDLFLSCNKWSGTLRNAEPHKCGGLIWHEEVSDASLKVLPYIELALSHISQNVFYSEIGWSWSYPKKNSTSLGTAR